MEAKTEDEIDFGRLATAVEKAYDSLETYRSVTLELVREYTGNYYETDNHGKESRYLNLVQQTIEAYMMLLAANRPRVMVSTQFDNYRAFAKHFEQAVNAMIKEIRLEDTLASWVLDAFFSIGIIKTHMADSGVVELEPDLWMDPGTPFASNVSLDDFVYDTRARKLSECKFMGDMYRVPFANLKDEMYDQEIVKDLKPTSKYEGNRDRIEDISKGNLLDEDEFEPMIDLADIWVPRTGMIYTFAVTNRSEFKISNKPIAEPIPWDGDELGPYHVLGFLNVPQNIMPVGMVPQLHDLDNLVNNLVRKNAGQAERQKDVTLYTAQGAAAAKQIERSRDGEFIQTNNPDQVKLYKYGGVDQNTFAFAMTSLELFDRMSGNLKALLGLGATTDTVGQEKLVHEASSKKEQYLQKAVAGATVRLITALSGMLWRDEFKEIAYTVSPDGYPEYSAQVAWKPGFREGNVLDYNFDIDVYSMQYQSPQSKMQAVNQLVTQLYVPMLEELRAQGGMLDLFELTAMMSQFLNLPELRQVIKFNGGSGEGVSPIAQVPRKAPQTTRNYVRRNVSGGQGDDMARQAMQMMSQPSPQAMGT